MTEEEVKINDALTKAGGSVDYAAVLLKMTSRKLKSLIESSPELSRVIAGLPPSESTSLAGSVEISPIQTLREQASVSDSERINSLVTAADAKLRCDLASCGYSDSEVDDALAMQHLASKNIKSTFELMHGGLTRTFIDCQLERREILRWLRELINRLRDTVAYPIGSEERNAMFSEARELSYWIRGIDDTVIRTNEVIHKGALAMVQARKGNDAPSKRRKIKGFASADMGENGND